RPRQRHDPRAARPPPAGEAAHARARRARDVPVRAAPASPAARRRLAADARGRRPGDGLMLVAISNTLRTYLTNAIPNTPGDWIEVAAFQQDNPPALPTANRLVIFLYAIEENAHL